MWLQCASCTVLGLVIGTVLLLTVRTPPFRTLRCSPPAHLGASPITPITPATLSLVHAPISRSTCIMVLVSAPEHPVLDSQACNSPLTCTPYRCLHSLALTKSSWRRLRSTIRLNPLHKRNRHPERRCGDVSEYRRAVRHHPPQHGGHGRYDTLDAPCNATNNISPHVAPVAYSFICVAWWIHISVPIRVVLHRGMFLACSATHHFNRVSPTFF